METGRHRPLARESARSYLPCALPRGDRGQYHVEAALSAGVKCGLRFKMQKAVIVEGPLGGGKTAEKDLELDETKAYEINVTVDLISGEVTIKTSGSMVTATPDRRLGSISYVGYAVLNTVTDFSPIEISTE